MTTSVLHVCTRYRRGGSEQRLRDFVRAVDAAHTVVIGEDSDLDQARADMPTATVELWPHLIRRPHPGHDARLLRALVARLRAERFDVIFTHQSKGGLAGRVAARLTGTPALHSVSMANTGPGYSRVNSAVFALAERSVARSAIGYAVVGDDLRQRIVANGVRDADCMIIRSGAQLPAPGADRLDRRLALGRLEGEPELAERPWIVAVGSLEPRKNAVMLPELLARVGAAMPGVRPVLFVAGDGPDRDQVAAEAERVGLGDDVRMLGHIDFAPELIAASDAIVMMSRAEGLPQVLVQAAAANTPFACFEVDGARELIRLGARGSVVAPGLLDDLAAATAVWLRRPVASTASLIDLTSWSPDQIAADYRELLQRALA